MRKAIASAGLAAMLSMGIGTSAVAHAAGVHATAQSQDDQGDKDDDGIGDKAGLFGLVGLLGLAGLAGRGGGGRRAGSGGGAPSASRSPRGGYTTDWSSR